MDKELKNKLDEINTYMSKIHIFKNDSINIQTNLHNKLIHAKDINIISEINFNILLEESIYNTLIKDMIIYSYEQQVLIYKLAHYDDPPSKLE